MANKLLVVMLNTDPARPSELGSPLLQAAAAASMEYDVEVILTGGAGRLAVRGVAESLRTHEGARKTIYDLLREAHQAGVVFKVSTSAAEIWGNDLIPEVEETVGGAYIISEAMDDDTVVLTY